MQKLRNVQEKCYRAMKDVMYQIKENGMLRERADNKDEVTFRSVKLSNSSHNYFKHTKKGFKC